MKKMTKQTRNGLLNALLIIGTIGLVIYLGTKNGDMGNAWNAMRTADIRWIGLTIGVWFVFVLCETLLLYTFYHFQHVHVSFGTTFLVTLIGMFYSNVTPAATGGQPMQVYAMKKRGVSAGTTTSGLAIKFFCFQTALLLIGALLWATHTGQVNACLGAERWFVYLGFILNGLTVVAVILLAISKSTVRAIITLCLKIGKALHIIKDLAKSTSRADAALQDFHASVFMLTHHPMQLLVLLLLSCVQVVGLMSIGYCVYRAVGQDSTSFATILTLQFLLFIGASFTPLPGSSGAQEGGFYLFFQTLYPTDKLLGALLLWRFFSYYFTLLMGLGGVIWDSARSLHGMPKQIRVDGIPPGEESFNEEQNSVPLSAPQEDSAAENDKKPNEQD